MYEYGEGGGVQDYVQAHAWYNTAYANGYSGKTITRDELAKLMTPEQIAEAQKLAREYFEKYKAK